MLETSNLQTMRLINACFWRKIKAVLQKNRGLLENILHFFSRFPGFLGFVPLQAIASQGQPAIKTLPKKSCLKTDGRFSVCSAMCHNRRMTVETAGRNEGCDCWMVIKCPPIARAAFCSAERQYRLRRKAEKPDQIRVNAVE